MSYKILVTGGAGFIGSFLVDQLIEQGHEIRILDNLEPQVHQGKTPDYLNPKAEFIKGDVLDMDTIKKAIEDVEIVFHEAAMVGVGQSMYQITRYVNANITGTANLLDVLVNKENSVKKVMVAASMSSYGEGAYKDASGNVVYPSIRPTTQLEKHDWVNKADDGSELTPIPTPETKPFHENSIYAITKANQEDMVLNIGKSYGIPSVALRYFNVFGPRQSLSNPYTGVAAIFMSRILNNNRPTVFEDGLQTRDFISVHDIVRANIMAMNSSSADYEMFNVGTGNPRSILGIAQTLAKICGKEIEPEVTGQFRKGDVRHCYADISKIKSAIGFEPKVSFEEGMQELIEWSKNQESVDKVDDATEELKKKGLLV